MIDCVIAVVLLTCFAGPLSAATSPPELPERPLFRQFGPAQGLPSSTVHKLAQDRLGNLWIATLDGLARYDGVDFTVWRHDPDAPASLAGNDVQQVIVDDNDRVWLAIQDGGIARYDPASNRFDHWRHDPDDPEGLPTDRIWAIADDGAGGLWLGGFRSGLSRLDAAGRFRHYRHDPEQPASLCDDIILSLARTADGTLWIGTAKGLCRWRDGEGFMATAIPPAGQQPAPRLVLGIEPDDGGRLWLSTDAGLRLLPNDAPSPPLPAIVAGVQGWATAIEPDGELWFGSSDGLRRWNLRNGATTIHRSHGSHPMALRAPAFLDVLRDREGSLWFASEGGGLAQLLPHWRAIRAYLPDPANEAGLPAGRVRMVTADHDGHLWVVANVNAGVGELDPVTGTTHAWFADSDGTQQPDARLLAVMRDRTGRLWTGHRNRIARYTFATGEYRFVEQDRHAQALPATLVRRFAEHPDGTVFAAFGGGGIARVEPETLALDFDPLGEAQGLPCAEVADIRLDAQGGIWLACEQGLLHADHAKAPFHAVDNAPELPIDGIAFAANDRLWLHALGLLAEYRLEDGRLVPGRSVDAHAGWPVVKAGGLVVDGAGIIWVTTSRGLYSYEPERNRIAAYDENDGLPSAEFSATPPVRLGPYLLAAGTMSGPVIIDTQRLRSPLPVADLRWHQASVTRGGERIPLALGSDIPIRLPYDDRDLSISVRMNSFAKPGAHRYRFRLDGYDAGWIEQTGDPERLFERIPSGRFTLHVDAVGSDGQPAGNQLTQILLVDLPPWRQPWAIALYLLALIVALYAAQRIYRRRLEQRHALALARERQQWAEQASDAKTRFLASVGHEIRTPMAGLLGMNALLLDSALDERQRHYARSVRHAGEHMLTLVNDLLDLSRVEAGKLVLEPCPVDLADLTDELVADVAAAAERKGLVLSVRIEPGTPLGVRADGKRLRQILLNFLTNAVKFTPHGRIRLIIETVGDRFQFAVDDDGPGLSEEMRRQLFQRYSQDALGRGSGGSGLGLSIAHELAQLMNGDIEAVNRETGGSRFCLTIPLDRDAAAEPVSAGLPPALIVDDDTTRADDLAASLTALGIKAHVAPTERTGIDIDANVVVLTAAANADAADAAIGRCGLADRPRIVSLPLTANALPESSATRQALPGPWRLKGIVNTMRAMTDAAILTDGADSSGDPWNLPAVVALHGLTLLIVEDDPILREVLATRLNEKGALIVAVDNGLSALAELDAASIDAVLLDLDLPEVDGLQVLNLMKLRMGSEAPPVIVVTARQQPDDEAQCLQAGARAFFRKPVDADVLAECLSRILGRSDPSI